MSKILLIIILSLIIIGLWFFPALTKVTLLGAASYVKSLAAQVGVLH